MTKLYFIFSFILCLPLFSMAQNVTTLNASANIDDGLILDAQGRLYGSRYQGSSIQRLLPDDNWSSSVFSDGYTTPNGLAFGANGDLFMADNQGDKIYRIFPDGTSEVFVDDIINPSGVIFELDSDTLIATSYEGNRILKIGPDGGYIVFSSGNLLNGPVGLCYDDDGRLYTGNFTDRRIIRFDESGNQTTLTQAGGTGPLGFITYAHGFIYGTLFNQHKIYRTDLVGNDTILMGGGAGTVDGDAQTARFNRPNGILASPSQDTLYVSDFTTGAVRMITELLPTTATSDLSETLPTVEMTVFPSPATSETQIELNLEEDISMSIEIFDPAGNQVIQLLPLQKMAAGKHRIPLHIHQLPAGMYHAVVNLIDGSRVSRSFVKP